MISVNGGFLILIATSLLLASISTSSAISRHHSNIKRDEYNFLNRLKQRSDFFLGLGVRSGQLAQISETNFQCIKPYMNMAVPQYEMKWNPIEFEGPGKFSFEGMDKILAWTIENDKKLRGHCGTWNEATPPWVEALDGKAYKDKLATALYNHIYAVVYRYGKHMHSFDVINEPFEKGGSGHFRDSVFSRNLGDDFYRIAFKAADDARQATGAKVKLYINEYGIEGEGSSELSKRAALLKMVKWMRSDGMAIDGVGIQGHLQSNNFPTNLPGMLTEFTNAGFETVFTELDIRMSNSDNSGESLDKQAKQYSMVYEACLDNTGCLGVVRWDIEDSTSWIPDNFPGEGRATIFEDNCKPKEKILKAISDVLDRH